MALTAKANDMRQKGDNVIILTVGEPDFDTPNHIKEAAVSAISQGQTKYTAIDGTPNLKKAIIHKFQNENGLSYSPNQIIASNGCKQSLFNFLQAFLNEGDEVILSTDKGKVIRCAVKEIRIAGRNTQGVRIFKLSGEEKVVSAIKIDDNFS